MLQERLALARAIDSAGGPSEVARRVGITSQAVQQWRRAPAHRVLELEAMSGVPRWELRPDLYPAERERAGR